MKRKLKMISKFILISLLFVTMGFLFTGFVFPEKRIPEKREVTDFKSPDGNMTPDGKELFETRCNICHGIKKDGTMSAPPFYNVKFRYLRVYGTKRAFENAIVNFVLDPQRKKALMYGAINRFGVMPKLPYPKEELTKIADYIYHAEFPRTGGWHNQGRNKWKY
ncbi:cytochrome c [Candidatus Sulfidibacterium hydrothermale]|uniref:c-type cytochrome n=1 Tax=Candidatus Sulfidibacterium hydrothermale TaxID=2875962 RepID=UPI001F0A4449|nr:c-type cytochrome [Candidatus Sulfidibacterium hydrothermale]UBM61496.1 cytochrome c [Candidatus Sulfidibacterium hydrothermale]